MHRHISRSSAENLSHPKVHVVYQRALMVPDVLELFDKWCAVSETQKIVFADFLCRHDLNKLLHDCSDVLFCSADETHLKITLNVTGTRVLVIYDGDPTPPVNDTITPLITHVVYFLTLCMVIRGGVYFVAAWRDA